MMSNFITDITPLDNKRRKVYINGKYAFPLYLKELDKFRLRENMEITPIIMQEINDLLHRRIRERALYLLEAMPRTECNIRRKLADNHYTEEYITPVIDELIYYGYIDDKAYAFNYASSMSCNRGMSRKMIAMKLYEKGISKEIVIEAVNTLPEDESELIDKILKKKGLTLSELNDLPYNEKQKIYRYLVSKGFSPSCINMY